ncbi:hypothetical protein H5S40_07950 [Limosilactobacillus sp. RRLNB_1_1]|uniref:Gram-positive cocci surface proteins LPxTG domain-containing protein n=1 Tax=Limosilactobacillus albertensis TaxID=2759752 RepID=A0A7W3TSH5_9LACO|nr:hypothetical protein [Limosilactobacillus albertensis]MBB1070082.1 hypothetical protein [Limosilactobacillus albertensis]MCD7117319.1 hypothetical protein [Limosilactobacillus albertensis]MCD7128923.1 hypothetical protein [Limosilactobacillus albertensis]
MVNKEHYKLFMDGKFLYTMALSTLAVAGTTATVHADAAQQAPAQQTTQTSQSAYQQKASQNEQQLSDLAASNAVKEDHAASSYAAANSANEAQTRQQVSELNDQLAAQKQQAADQIQVASAAMTDQINTQTKAANDSAAAATQQQQAANSAAEAQMQTANSNAIAQAQQAASQAAQNSAAAIKSAQDQYQSTVNEATGVRDSSIKAANASYNQGVTNENNTYQANQQQLTNELTGVQNAVNQAQQDVKDHTTTETVNVPAQQNKDLLRITNAMEDQGNGRAYGAIMMGNPISIIDATFPKSNWTNPLYRDVNYGLYADSVTTINNTNVPTTVEEMPTDFVPGLIAYNPKLDQSEVVSENGLTDAQKNIIASFMTSWANGFRNWIYSNNRGMWNDANEHLFYRNFAPRTLKYTTVMQQVAKEIAQQRINDHLTNNTHTHNFTRTNTLQNVQKAFEDLTQSTTVFDGDYSNGNTSGSLENLEGLVPYVNINGQPTLLGYLVGAYNSTQAMWYGEIYNDQPGHYNLGGHAHSILNNDLDYITTAFEPISEVLAGDDKTPTSSYIKGAKYALTIDAYDWDFYGTKAPEYIAVNPAEVPASVNAVVNAANAKIDALLGSDATAPEFIAAQNRSKGHTETRTVVPAQYTNALKNAQNNLAEVQKNQTAKSNQLTAQHQSNLQSLTDQKNAAIKKANDTFDATVKQAAITRDSKIAEAKGSHSRVDQLKHELDQKYQDLVKADQAKLAQIETDRQQKIAQIKQDAKRDYDAKVAKINANRSDIQAKIDALLQSHKDFVKANADKLAQLKADDAKAYNDLKAKLDAELAAMLPKNDDTNNSHVINTKDHTVILPDDKTKENHSATTDDKVSKDDHASAPVEHHDSNSAQSSVTSAVSENANGVKPAKQSSTVERPAQTAVVSEKPAVTNDDTVLSASDGTVFVPNVETTAIDETTASNAVSTDSADVNVTVHQTNKQRTLPSTGNYNNWGVIAFGAIVAMFGLSLTGKKRHV